MDAVGGCFTERFGELCELREPGNVHVWEWDFGV